ncbi:hypothetical protein CHS0354_008822, partial [Potamilus streckersoni]
MDTIQTRYLPRQSALRASITSKQVSHCHIQAKQTEERLQVEMENLNKLYSDCLIL